MPSRKELLRKLGVLCDIKNCTTKKHVAILKHLDPQTIELLCETSHNIVSSNRKKHSRKILERLKNYKRELIYLSKPSNSLSRKKDLLTGKQSGTGLISILLSVSIIGI